MPPKKPVEELKKNKLGRPGNNLKMGIVGMANVGKSTTFNCMCKLNVPAENYPFCTIDPNIAKVAVPDERFDKLCKIFKPKSEVAAILSIVDIAGLVPGAHKGEGLGNAFLSHIRETDGIFHVVRAFDDPEVSHTEVDVNPVRDMGIIYEELLLKDLEYCENRVNDINNKIKRQNDKDCTEEKETMEKALALLQSKKWIRTGEWNTKDVDQLNKHNFITAKNVCYLVNLSKEDFLKKKNKWLMPIKQWVDANCPGEIIPYSADFEREVLYENQALIQKNIEEFKQVDKYEATAPTKSIMNRIIKSGYKLLDLIYFFTSGEDEVRCWTVRNGSKAPQAAGVIHTDFEKGFICAEVMKYDDFIALGSQAECKAQGKYRQQGKEFIIEDGDMCFFKFNKPNAPKKVEK